MYYFKQLSYFVCLIGFSCFSFQAFAQTSGCTDALAINFNTNATINDGSCEYAQVSVSPVNTSLLPEVLNETSGLILWNNKIWTHNDDTDIHLYGIDINDINTMVNLPLSSTENIDWEEIAQDDTYLYVGDFGNNANGNRTNLKILRVEKSSLLAKVPDIDYIDFSYALQTDFTPKGANQTNFDCEAFIVSKDKIYLFTKEWISRKTTVYSLPKHPGTYVAEYVSEYDVDGLITGATVLEDKHLVVLSGYSDNFKPFVFLLYDFQNSEFFEGNKRKIELELPFHQVEGITSENGLDYIISNERFSYSGTTTEAKLHSIDLSDFLGEYLETLSLNFSDAGNPKLISLYPSPAETLLNFKLNSYNFDYLYLQIYNQTGQEINSFKVISDSFQVDVSDFSTGIYYYTILGKAKSAIKGKFIVK